MARHGPSGGITNLRPNRSRRPGGRREPAVGILVWAVLACAAASLVPTAAFAVSSPAGSDWRGTTPKLASHATHSGWGTVTYTPAGWPIPLQGDLWGPAPTSSGVWPGIVMIHGGGFTKGTRDWNTGISQWLADNGYVVLNIDYRLAPTWVYPAMEQDALQAIQWLRDRPYIASVSVFGTSAGAVIAEELANSWSTGLASAVAWSGMGDYDPNDSGPTDHLGCSQTECPRLFEDAEPISHIDKSDTPLFVAHSLGDTHIACWTDSDFISQYIRPHGYYEPSGTEHGTDFLGDATAKSQTLGFLRAPDRPGSKSWQRWPG